MCRALWDGGVPRDALHLVMGGGEEVGEAILGHPLTQGMAFTGSWEVGMRILRTFSRAWPKPVVVEMGGKNPTVVTAAADLDAAATAVARAAFGFGGQKCSACSRAYVERAVADEFTDRLLAATRGLTVGNPLGRDVFLGPLIHQRAVDSFTRYVEGVRAAGGDILAGGNALTEGDLAHGHYVEPTVATLPDPSHPYFTEEMFVPLLLVHPVAGLDEALALCNHAPYGLTAGLFSRDPAEVERFLDGIEAGVTYVNRKSGSTTGAWPGVNPFGGWKASGGTGPAALGPHYLLKFLREQSRAVSEVQEELLDNEDMIGYENSKSTLEFVRALGHRANHLRASRSDLEALATAGERILKTDAAAHEPTLSSYTIRASIIVMICATIDSILMDLATETRKTEGLTPDPTDRRGSSLEPSKEFFKKVAQLRFPDETETWSRLKNLFELRDAIAHEWGRINEEARRKAVEALGVVVSETGEVRLDAATVREALSIMQSFTDELEAYLGGDQKPTDGG